MAESQCGTLAANAAATITFEADYQAVEVCNVDGTAPIVVTVDGATPSVSGGVGMVMLPAAICEKRIASPAGQPTVVKLVSSGTPRYSVNGA